MQLPCRAELLEAVSQEDMVEMQQAVLAALEQVTGAHQHCRALAPQLPVAQATCKPLSIIGRAAQP